MSEKEFWGSIPDFKNYEASNTDKKDNWELITYTKSDEYMEWEVG